jgi:Ser/Thr protein kinase RdoA (MazF antagonist)
VRLTTPDDVQYVCDVQSRLQEAGLPVPGIIRNAAGQAVTRTQEASYVLYPWVAGRHHQRGEIPARAAYAMGRALGQLQQALAGMLPSAAYVAADPAAKAAELQQLLSLAEQGREPVDAIACDLLRYKLSAVARLAHLTPSFAALTAQWVHGDYQETNVLFDDEDRVTAVLDWDNLRLRPRGHEFMRAFAYCFQPGAPECEAFFRGYAGIVRPDPDEVSLYPLLWAYVSATGDWPMNQRYRRPELYQSRWDRFIMPPSDWWERELGNLAARFRSWL